jgi:A/G-specific adenine glycosylase
MRERNSFNLFSGRFRREQERPVQYAGRIHSTGILALTGERVNIVTNSILSPGQIDRFREQLYRFYRKHRREMPWRNTKDPYAVLVSEIMLQQTQVERVMLKYPEFIHAFPDFGSLASAPFPEILRIWQGMGYNRRAKFLKEIARTVVREYAGILPDDPEVLGRFPGIGRATAGSIAAFAYDRPVVFIETNIRRVFIHCFFPDQEEVHDTGILPLVRETLDRENPREWYYALMDYGTYLKRSVPNPNRRSRHYQRQPPFEGSDRRIRGEIIRIVLAEPGIPVPDLARRIGCEPERLERILGALVGEGFIRCDGDSLVISG